MSDEPTRCVFGHDSTKVVYMSDRVKQELLHNCFSME